MNDHLAEGTLQGYLDGEMEGDAADAVRGHLEGCAECRLELERLEALAGAVTAALDVLDPPVDLGAARWSRRVRRADRRRGGSRQRRPLAAAAAILLLFSAGVAAALPGSPIRDWWEGRGGVEEAATPAALETRDEATGVFAALSAGTADVELRGVASGAWIAVEFVPGERMGAFAPAGSRFQTGAGRIGVDVTPPGPTPAGGGQRPEDSTLRVELPASADRAELRVNGALLLRRTREGLLIPGAPQIDSALGVIRIQVPEAADHRDPR